MHDSVSEIKPAKRPRKKPVSPDITTAMPENPESRPGPAPADTSDLTPAMRQYLEQKAQVGDALLLFRMGDFYETFFEDAKIIAHVLGLTLTARSRHAENPIPLAGVPYHSVDTYVARLVRAGYKVAISEQIEDPRTAKGVVKRAVQRIITPGTLTDDALLDERTPNHLVALAPVSGNWQADRIGMACIELASGGFQCEMIQRVALFDELARLRPAEVLVPECGIDAESAFVESLRETIGCAVTTRMAHVFSTHQAEQTLYRHFKIASLAGFGFDRLDEGLCAAAALLDYLNETQKSSLGHIHCLLPRQSSGCVMIDQVTLRSLEIERCLRDGARDGSLLGAIDLTVNPMGARRLREWLCFPLANPIEITRRQDAIAALLAQPERLRALREGLKSVGDLERITARLGIGRATPRDMLVLGRTLLRAGELAEIIGRSVQGPASEDTSAAAADLLSALREHLCNHNELGQYLTGALKENAPPVLREAGFVADGFDAELDRLRNIGSDGQEWLAAYQARESARTGIPTLKVGFNSVFGYYIEITHLHRDKVPADYVRKQTVRNAERYITDELKRHEEEVLGAADRAKQLEFAIFEKIRAKAAEHLAVLRETADALAALDVLASLAELARTRGYCRPELAPSNQDRVLQIVDGRHPVLDATQRERFVPNDCHLASDDSLFLIITGPNMAGKSTFIRQVALLTLLAQTGSYVPAKSMRWSPVDRIFARVGASDELSRGLSTFMVEMVETTRILHNATPSSLVILDEIGRGTSTYDGLSLAWAITEHIAQRIGCRTLFATHYHELTTLAEQIRDVANFNVAVREQLRPDGAARDVVFLHRIVPGPADRSYGVHVAAMAGMPLSIVKRAETILADLEQNFRSGSSHRVAPTGRRSRTDTNQLSLFTEPDPMPAWWAELVDRLGAIEPEKTTPLEALTILQELKQIAQKST